MAEVEIPATSTIAKDIPIASGNEVTSDSVVSNVDVSVSVEFGTSPTQERSSNSHPHDSEYDTASDLEGGEEYDESDDDDDDDLEDDEEDDLTDEDDDDIDDEEEEVERPIVDASVVGAGSQEKVSEAEIQKKVDEDRSNPQYIPKRGTFYEHDDRTADGDGECVLAIGDPECDDGGVTGTVTNSKATSQAPSISHASKTMKKWQPASGVERWSHDRFEESEQQPKSRTELISSYGYDIRTEDAPPRARRRRRYARGPTKYSRNWEDESAYIKITNKERKPPRASDFPALNERTTRKQKREPRERDENVRDEKENRPERRRAPINKSSVNDRLNIAAGRSNESEEPREREDARARISGRGTGKVQGRQSNGPGRQAAMEFKPKNRNSKQQQNNNTHNNSRSDERNYDRPQQRGGGGQYQTGNQQNNSSHEQYQQRSSMKGNHSMSASNMKQAQQQQQHHHHHHHHQQQFHGDNYGNNSSNNHSTKYNEQHGGYSQQQSSIQHHPQSQQGLTQLRQPMPLKSTPPPSNLSQRLQQVQNRNDPSHVGSVQMHALASQNQQQQQQLVMGQQQNTNAMLISAVAQQHQQQQQLMQNQPQEQRGPPKRYSSMRRSQHDQQHLADSHPTHQQQQQQQMQQLHMQQQQPPLQQANQAPPQQLMMQDQHSIMQANLLQQLYHQENLQAQMQALQVSQPPATQQAKPAYAAVPPTSTPASQPQAYGGNPPNAAYYVTDAYGTATSNAQPAPQPSQYAPQPPHQQPAYLAPNPAGAAIGYTNPPPPTQALQAGPPIQAGPPTGVYAGPGGPAGPGPAPSNSNPNFTNYQNFNTVGGTTYFVPPAPTTSRPAVLPQRRPTNAIPILPPAEKNRQRGNDDPSKSQSNNGGIGSAENIDHIIDNMFVQRPVFQPPQNAANPLSARQSSSPSNSDSISSNTGTDTQAQTTNVDDSNAASNSLGGSSSETTSSTPVGNDVEVASATNSASSTENSGNNNPVTPPE